MRGRITARHAAGAIEKLEPRRLLSSYLPTGSQFRVNAFTTDFQSESAVAMDADGNFVVTWVSRGQDGSSYGVYAQRYNAAGAAQGGEVRVNTYTIGGQRSPSIAMDPDGDFVIVWHSNGQDGSLNGVYAQRYDSEGNPQGGEFEVNTSTTGEQWFPAVAMASDGSFGVAWWEFVTGTPSSNTTHARLYDASGNARGDSFRVDNWTNGGGPLNIAMRRNGDFVIAWTGTGQGDGFGVFARRYNASGVAQSDPFLVNTHTTGGQQDPRVAMDEDGDFTIAWVNRDGYIINAQRYNAAGVPVGTEHTVGMTTANFSPPGIGMDANGDTAITWQNSLINHDVYARRFDAAGVTQGGEFRVNSYSTGTQQVPAIAISPDGDHVITWHGEGATDGAGVWAQRYGVLPTVQSAAFLFDTAPHSIRFDFDHDVLASLSVSDLRVDNLTTAQQIPSGDFVLSYEAATDTATFTYTGSAGEFPGVLPDGNYTAKALAAGISTPQGVPMAGDYSFNFRFLLADADNSGAVNLADFNILAANFGASGRTFSQGNFNYDAAGTVSLADFNILAGRFGQVLAAARARPMFEGWVTSCDDDILADLPRCVVA